MFYLYSDSMPKVSVVSPLGRTRSCDVRPTRSTFDTDISVYANNTKHHSPLYCRSYSVI